ncbi:hypothetical protein V8F20_010526 [Naviculisporaceae sp. PSN 640]
MNDAMTDELYNSLRYLPSRYKQPPKSTHTHGKECQDIKLPFVTKYPALYYHDCQTKEWWESYLSPDERELIGGVPHSHKQETTSPKPIESLHSRDRHEYSGGNMNSQMMEGHMSVASVDGTVHKEEYRDPDPLEEEYRRYKDRKRDEDHQPRASNQQEDLPRASNRHEDQPRVNHQDKHPQVYYQDKHPQVYYQDKQPQVYPPDNVLQVYHPPGPSSRRHHLQGYRRPNDQARRQPDQQFDDSDLEWEERVDEPDLSHNRNTARELLRSEEPRRPSYSMRDRTEACNSSMVEQLPSRPLQQPTPSYDMHRQPESYSRSIPGQQTSQQLLVVGQTDIPTTRNVTNVTIKVNVHLNKPNHDQHVSHYQTSGGYAPQSQSPLQPARVIEIPDSPETGHPANSDTNKGWLPVPPLRMDSKNRGESRRNTGQMLLEGVESIDQKGKRPDCEQRQDEFRMRNRQMPMDNGWMTTAHVPSSVTAGADPNSATPATVPGNLVHDVDAPPIRPHTDRELKFRTAAESHPSAGMLMQPHTPFLETDRESSKSTTRYNDRNMGRTPERVGNNEFSLDERRSLNKASDLNLTDQKPKEASEKHKALLKRLFASRKESKRDQTSPPHISPPPPAKQMPLSQLKETSSRPHTPVPPPVKQLPPPQSKKTPPSVPEHRRPEGHKDNSSNISHSRETTPTAVPSGSQSSRAIPPKPVATPSSNQSSKVIPPQPAATSSSNQSSKVIPLKPVASHGTTSHSGPPRSQTVDITSQTGSGVKESRRQRKKRNRENQKKAMAQPEPTGSSQKQNNATAPPFMTQAKSGQKNKPAKAHPPNDKVQTRQPKIKK